MTQLPAAIIIASWYYLMDTRVAASYIPRLAAHTLAGIYPHYEIKIFTDYDIFLGLKGGEACESRIPGPLKKMGMAGNRHCRGGADDGSECAKNNRAYRSRIVRDVVARA